MKLLVVIFLLTLAACTSAPIKSSRLEDQKKLLQAAGFDVSYKN